METEKYDKRRGLDCEFISESKIPGYYIYKLIIGETDGSETIEYSLGVDMQDAISRIVKKDRVKNVEDRFKHQGFLVVFSIIFWILLMVIPGILVATTKNPIWFLITLGVGLIAGSTWWLWNRMTKNLNKKTDKNLVNETDSVQE